MYAIIMGGGRVGLALSNLLIEEGFDITLIENDETLCAEVASELDALVICGNGTSSKLLEESNIEDADYFIATTGNDEANLLSCILVRKYDVETIIARVSNPDHEEAFKEVGIDRVISPEISAARDLAQFVTNPTASKLTTLGEGDAEIIEMTITNDKVVGKRYKDISPTKDYNIIAMYENGKLVIPQPDNTISRGQKVSILVRRGTMKKVSRKLERL
ncbi:TrkA family potassium uptake protein [Methanobrevibacter sp.]|uniref:potassium channel family protein n=1 Tax=Methanobrevibacter sp. TaxID=66852 RepID=UPI0025EA8240|nr:TrkA family potassium uptake protein [Methanobrevibacter sp.]MBQ2830933.1 TrkA family potassium uptake protein [Methanobrevibacter sp.]